MIANFVPLFFSYIDHKVTYYIGNQGFDCCLCETTTSNDAGNYILDFDSYIYVSKR